MPPSDHIRERFRLQGPFPINERVFPPFSLRQTSLLTLFSPHAVNHRMLSPETLREKALHDQAQSLREEAQAARTEADHKQMIVDRLSEASGKSWLYCVLPREV